MYLNQVFLEEEDIADEEEQVTNIMYFTFELKFELTIVLTFSYVTSSSICWITNIGCLHHHQDDPPPITEREKRRRDREEKEARKKPTSEAYEVSAACYNIMHILDCHICIHNQFSLLAPTGALVLMMVYYIYNFFRF